MTVAVTQGGRLLLSKAYGYALVDGTRKLPMKPCHRCRFGSACKALVTGPSGFQLMKSKGIDPKSTKLYGSRKDSLVAFLMQTSISASKPILLNQPSGRSGTKKSPFKICWIMNLAFHKQAKIMGAAAKMFGVSEDQLTYEQGHRYFLRVQGLVHEPGTYEYSNHNFGLWTILIPKMSGKSYLDYVREDFLKPMKLHNAVRPERANPDSCDAWNHKYNADKEPEVFPFEEHGLGLAAGGFRASAQELARLMVELDKKYTTEELDSMGWKIEQPKGKLEHGGALAGGKSYVAMFPKGYIDNKLDLSEVHVAVVTNSWPDINLEALAGKIALAVPTSNVPATFDIWKQGKSVCSCEYVRRGVPANQYQEVVEEAVGAGYRLEWIDGYTDDGKVHFNAIFRTNDPAIARRVITT